MTDSGSAPEEPQTFVFWFQPTRRLLPVFHHHHQQQQQDEELDDDTDVLGYQD